MECMIPRSFVYYKLFLKFCSDGLNQLLMCLKIIANTIKDKTQVHVVSLQLNEILRLYTISTNKLHIVY